MSQEGDVRKVNGEWFALIEEDQVCDECGNEVYGKGWYNIQKAIDNIKRLEDKNVPL